MSKDQVIVIGIDHDTVCATTAVPDSMAEIDNKQLDNSVTQIRQQCPIIIDKNI